MIIVEFFKKYGITYLDYYYYNYFHIIFNPKKFPEYYKLKYDFLDITEIHWYYLGHITEYTLSGMDEYKKTRRITDVDDIIIFQTIQQELKLLENIEDYIFWLTKHGRIKKRLRHSN